MGIKPRAFTYRKPLEQYYISPNSDVLAFLWRYTKQMLLGIDIDSVWKCFALRQRNESSEAVLRAVFRSLPDPDIASRGIYFDVCSFDPVNMTPAVFSATFCNMRRFVSSCQQRGGVGWGCGALLFSSSHKLSGSQSSSSNVTVYFVALLSLAHLKANQGSYNRSQDAR